MSKYKQQFVIICCLCGFAFFFFQFMLSFIMVKKDCALFFIPLK